MSDSFMVFVKENLSALYATGLSLYGGIAHYALRVREGEKPSWSSALASGVLCMFCGHISYFVCGKLGIVGYDMALVVATSAFAGVPALKRVLKEKAGIDLG